MKNSQSEEIKYSSRIEKYHSKTKATKHKKVGRKIEQETVDNIEDIIVLEEDTAPAAAKENKEAAPVSDDFYISRSELTRGVFDEDFLKAEEEAKKAAEEAERKAREEAERKALEEAEAKKAAEEEARKAFEEAERAAEEEANKALEETEAEEADTAVKIEYDEDKKFSEELLKFEAEIEAIKEAEEIEVSIEATEAAEETEVSIEAAEETEDLEKTAVIAIPRDIIKADDDEEFEEEFIIEKPKKKISKTAKAWIITIVCVAVAICAMLLFVFEIVTVDGFSMQPTLNGGEKVIVEKVSRYAAFPERGQIIATKYDGYDGYYLKRVIAYPGEWVEIYDNTVYINGEALKEDYIASDAAYNNMELTEVPEDHIFVMGDNREMSLDSRQDSIGCIHESNILGNAWCVIWPFEDIRLID